MEAVNMGDTADQDFVIARVEPACRMLAEARDAPQAKHVADVARLAKVWARRKKLGWEAVRCARAVEVDALRLMGRYLKAGPKNRGNAGKGRPKKGDAEVESPNEF
jgi:hypothetical protein